MVTEKNRYIWDRKIDLPSTVIYFEPLALERALQAYYIGTVSLPTVAYHV
jgi:hypothetical protein